MPGPVSLCWAIHPFALHQRPANPKVLFIPAPLPQKLCDVRGWKTARIDGSTDVNKRQVGWGKSGPSPGGYGIMGYLAGCRDAFRAGQQAEEGLR